MWLFEFTWQISVILLLVFANGFFVAAEFALVKVRATQLKPMARQGSWQAKLALKLVKHLDAYLSMTQLGITLTSLALGWAGKPYLGVWMERFVAWLGLGHYFDAQTISMLTVAVTFSVISYLHIVLGELAPKSLAIQHPRVTTMWISPL